MHRKTSVGASLTLFKRDPEISFSALLTELYTEGYGWREIAAFGGFNEGTVRYWAKDADSIPNYEDGRLLCQIYQFVFKRPPPTRNWRTEAANRYA